MAGRLHIGCAIVGAAAVQYAYVRHEKQSAHHAVDPSTLPDVDVATLKPATRLRTFAQCVGKGDLRSGLWKTTSFNESAKCGEDSFFIADEERSFGVADGVGGWSRHGVNPKEFSEKLMQETKKHIVESQHRSITTEGCAADVVAAVDAAHKVALRTVKAGSSTAIVASLDKNTSTLHTINVGDSGLVVIRGGKPAFVAEETSHSFNFPRQLGVQRGRHTGDTVAVGSKQKVAVYSGDVIVTASDGVLDNLEAHEIAAIVARSDGGRNPQAAARNLLVAVCESANGEKHKFPHRVGGKSWDEGGVGGKPDDITVLVTQVL